MSFALSTILLFIIIMPGLVARFCYFTKPFSNGARSIDFATELFWSIIPGFILQFIYIIAVESLTPFKINFSYIGALIDGIKDDEGKELSMIMSNIHTHLSDILTYNILLIVISGGIGYFLKVIVRTFGIDKKWEFFRFNNKWYYILSGEILDMEDSVSESKDITVIGVDILCKIGDKNIIYVGELVNYYLNSSGDLDAILIKYPMRRSLEKDSVVDQDDADPPARTGKDETRYYQIPGDYLYIPYRDVANLNINYFDLKS